MVETPAAAPLSQTELEILREVATGATNREIAHKRSISEATVKKHLSNINGKLGTSNRTEAVRIGMEQGLVTVDTPGDNGASVEATRRLAQELQRTRERARHMVLWILAVAVAIVGALVAWVFLIQPNTVPQAVPTPTLRPPARPRWQLRASLPAARADFVLADDPSGLYAIAGRGADGPLDDTLRYDRENLRWVPLSPKPMAVAYVAGVSVAGRIIVPGGCRAGGRAVAAVEAYNPRRDAWEEMPSLPAPRCDYALVVEEGRVYLFGGRAGPGPDTAAAQVWRLDPGAEAWLEEPDMPDPRSGFAAIAMGDGIHVLGGYDQAGEATRDHWVFVPDPSARQRWKVTQSQPGEAPPLPEARAGHAAVKILDKIVLIGGGQDAPLDSLVWDGTHTDWRVDPQRLPNPEGAPGLPSPQHGMGTTIENDKTVVLAGGESIEGRLLNIHISYSVVQIFVTGP